MPYARLLASALCLFACVGTAEAQRPPARRDAGAASPARDPRHVVNPARGAWQARCVASAGCAAPQAIPRCAPPAPNERTIPPQPLTAVWDQRFTLAGQSVAVRGTLRAGGGCTERGCPDGVCCNHCSGRIDLIDRPSRENRWLGIGADNAPAFTCTGDDSGLCCGTAVPAGTVVVRGTLRAIPNSGGHYRIEAPALCVE